MSTTEQLVARLRDANAFARRDILATVAADYGQGFADRLAAQLTAEDFGAASEPRGRRR